MPPLAALSTFELEKKFLALIRKKYPYRPGTTKTERVVKLSPDDERELLACAIESNRRDAIRIREQYAPRQLTLFFMEHL